MTGVAGRYLAEYRHDPGLLSAVVRRWRPYALALPVLAGLTVLVGVWISGMALNPTAMALLALWTVTNGLWAMQTAALTGLQRFDLVFLANAIAGTIIVASAVLISLEGADPGPLFGLMAVAAGVGLLVGLRQTWRLGGSAPVVVDVSRWRAIRHYAMNMWLTALLWSLVWSRGEMPIVRAHLGDAGVAHYAAALTLFGGALQGVMLAVSGVAPQLTRLWGEGSREQAVALARKLLDAQLLLCGLAAVFLICFSPELMQLAFGPSYRSQSETLVMLSLGLLAMAVSCQNHLLQIATDARFNRNATLLGLVVLVGLSGWLVAYAGLPGAGLSRAATMLIMAAVTLLMVQSRWGSAAYYGRNIAAAFLVVAFSAGLVLWQGDLHWPLRTAMAGLATFLLIVAVRDLNGRLQAIVIFRRVGQSIVARFPSAKKAARS